MEGVETKQLLQVDGTVLVGETREHLQHIVNEFERSCDRQKRLKSYVTKSKVFVVKKDQRGRCERVSRAEM